MSSREVKDKKCDNGHWSHHMIIPRCSDDKCTIADGCHCSGSEPPVEIAKRPQIVYLTFDDAFTAQAEEQFYRSVFDGTYKNPNGCTIRGTHFITQVTSSG